MFVKGISGTLMEVKESHQTRFEFVVWFPFTRNSMSVIREGSLIAAKNFASDNQSDHYSVMRITSVLPSHYALGTGLSGYPGFVEEAAVNASKDWSQEKPTEDTTKIVCRTIPSLLEIKSTNRLKSIQEEPKIESESNIPMTGERVHLLNEEWMGRIINRDIQKIQDQAITLGTLANSANVDILVLWDDMIRTHFGVFAYTNAGKSNLLSTLTAKVFENAKDVKMIIYDLMGEYGALLIDVLCNNPEANIVYLSPQAMPNSVKLFWESQSNEDLDAAAKDIVNTTILPKNLKKRQNDFIQPVKQILKNGQIRLLYLDGKLTDYVSTTVESAASGKSQALSDFVAFVNTINTHNEITVSSVEGLELKIKNYQIPSKSGIKAGDAKKHLLQSLNQIKQQVIYTDSIDSKFQISQDDIINAMNMHNKKSLYILQDSDDARVRQTSHELGRDMLKIRRKKGQISPPVSFIYDEADQFIAQDNSDFRMAESKKAAQQLARRGRKYGLGIGIATQRIVYLDTSVLGQPHTYLVSKLPRATDRERIQEAFGLSDEVLGESLRFNMGQWLLISHSATGIDGLPIPVQLPDANVRIAEFLDEVHES